MQAQHLLNRAIIVAGTMVFACATAEARQAPGIPPRDRPPIPQVGTASIKGRVVDAATGVPVARARVRLQGPPVAIASALTDVSGAFSFAELPAGPYSLFVEKATYLPGRYPEPGRSLRTSSRPFVIRDGQVIEGITVSLAWGGAIAGRVVDAYGDPVESADVRVMRLPRSGRAARPLMRSSNATNDLGEFRVARLEPGSYLLLVVPRNPNWDGAAEAQPIATYYPGVPAIDQAQPVTLARGESMTGLEVAIVEGETTLVTGSVIDAQGQAVPTGAYVSARPVMKDVAGGWWEAGGTSVRPDGTFRLKLAPGEYQLEARAMRPGVGGPGRPGDELLGMLPLSVGGESVSGVAITLGSGARVSGRIVFDGKSAIPSDAGHLRLGFESPGPGCRPGRSEVAPNWTFTVEGLSGTCVARMFGGIGPWTLKTIVHDGVELIDRPMTFEPDQHLRNVQVVLTDRRTELAFRVIDERGQATREYVAIVFPADKARWVEGSPYVRPYVPPPLAGQPLDAPKRVPTAPARGRRDSISGLRPGEYFVVAVDDVDVEDSGDPALLDRLARDAVRITLGEGSGVEVDLRRVTLGDRR